MTGRALPRTIEWVGGIDGYASLIDQTRLPAELTLLQCRDAETMWQAIKRLQVRGAPAIGIAAAMGAFLGVRDYAGSDRDGLLACLDKICEYLSSARPTAANLNWALNRMRRCARATQSSVVNEIKQALLLEVRKIRDEDARMCRAIGRHGEQLIPDGCAVLTHCNAGALATAEFGTALAPLYTAHGHNRSFRVYVTETRPLLQGARLTAWELQQAGIGVTLLCDNMAGALMSEGKVNLVITGADRIARNGDVANKIGTYSLAVLAKAHRMPFYVAAPSSTFDLTIASGSDIPIEHRDPQEVRSTFGIATAPMDVPCYCPAFDVTPGHMIEAIVTELGVISPVCADTIVEIMARSDPCPEGTPAA